MPYSNVPAGDTGKMDDCVKKVTAQGHSKKSAIKICYASIVGKDMTAKAIARKAHRADERKLAAERRAADLTHKADLTAQAAADARAVVQELEPAGHPEPGQQTLDVEAGKAGQTPSAERKDWDDDCDDGTYAPYRPYGGATSIADALAAMDAQEQADAIQRAAWIFQDITGNILNNDMITDKAAAIATAAGELQALLNDPTPLMKDKDAPVEPPVATPAPEAKAPAAAPAASMSADMPLTMPGTFQVFKALDGQNYAMGRVTNKWRDRDFAKHPGGEIITDGAHKEFLEFLTANPSQAPELWSWHTPGTARKSRAVWWDYADGFVSLLWPLEESEAKQFDPSETLAMSHGFFALARDTGQGLITKYRSFEGSELPPEWAANPWTSLDVLKEAKAMSFSKDQRDFLVKRFGEDRVAAIEADTANLAKALEALGVESKSAATAASHLPPELPGVRTGETAPAPAPAGPAAEAAFDAIKSLLNVDGLNTVITELQKQNQTLAAQAALVPELQKQLAALDVTVKQLSKSDDDKLAEQIQPKVKPIVWGFQASADDKSKLTDAEKEKFRIKKPSTTEGKDTSWVGEVFSPIAAPVA